MSFSRESKRIMIIGLLLSVFAFASLSAQSAQTDAIDPFFTLVFKTNGGGVRPDYGNFLKQHLARIGIDVDVIIQDWPTFVGELLAFRDFDICYVGFSGKGADPDFSGVYNENASLNLFGYHTSMDYDEELGTGKNEWFIQEGKQIMPPNSIERINHYWDWEQYMMDKICPLLPTFIAKEYQATWANLVGYNYSKGLKQSWGHMSWDGTHTGQLSTNEIVIADAAWSDLNPLFQDDSSSSFISNAVMDPLIWYDADLSVWPHLAESYEYINDTTIEIKCREGIKWQSDPDGNFTEEYFDVEDIYFTLKAWGGTSCDNSGWDWIEELEIIDQMTLRIYVDGDRFTPGYQPYAPSLPILSLRILPEHYLNQTQLKDGVTPDISHPSWTIYATNVFGTGLFEISSYTEYVETILTVKSDSWWLNTSITNDPNLQWNERFGDFTGGLNQLRVRIIDDEVAALQAFEEGSIDILTVTDNIDKRKYYESNTDFDVQNKLDTSFEFYGFNMREERDFIGDRTISERNPDLTIGLAVRKAICYAIDRDEINTVLHSGENAINHWPIHPTMAIWCNPSIIEYSFDLDKAREYIYYADLSGWCTQPSSGFTIWIGIGTTTILGVIFLIRFRKKK